MILKFFLTDNYKGYDTSIGWFNYSDEKVRENIKKSMDAGFDSMKLKVGSPDHERDLRRAYMVRECAGDSATVMLDCNQQWQLQESIEFGLKHTDDAIEYAMQYARGKPKEL